MRRIAIIGTAQSYREAPYQDPSVELWSLNDAYCVKGGLPRVDAWYDLHPLDHFYYPPESNPDGSQPKVFAHQVPPGYYVRPTAHLDWLATQPFPVWVHPDHATQVPASAEWPSARAFPKAAIEDAFGMYFSSTPAWMLAHALIQGITDIEIYGIHLATESEYVEQRPNFEFLCGSLLGPGPRTLTVEGKKRIYQSTQGRLVLPVSSPILQASYQYAFQPSPRRKGDKLTWELHKADVKKQRRVKALMDRRLGLPWVTIEEPNKDGVLVKRTTTASTLQTEIRYYDALIADLSDQVRIVQQGA
jgi:hypothetical protein